jgi:hypothetical protein
MFYAPGQTFHAEFITTRFSTGAAFDATGTPVATATRNGTDDSGFVLTVTKMAGTGRYKVSGTVPSSYALHDRVQVSITATVDGVAKAGIVEEFQVLALTDLADAILARGAAEVQTWADKHSLCYVILAMSEYQFTPDGQELTIFETNGENAFTTKQILRKASLKPIRACTT